MSDIAKLIADVTAHGGRLWLDGGTVRYAAPRGALPDALMARMRDAKAAIGAHLAAAHLVVTARPRGDAMPVSCEEMFFFDPARNDRTGFPVLRLFFRLTGGWQADALARAIEDMAARHEILRTNYAELAARAVRRIAPPGTVRVRRVDAPGWDDGALHQKMAELGMADSAMSDLTEARLFRATVLTRGDEIFLILAGHHITYDGDSWVILLEEIVAAYAALANDAPPPPAPAIQYADYAACQHDWLQGAPVVDFWRETLSGLPPPLALDLDGGALSDKPAPRQTAPIAIAAAEAAALAKLGEAQGASLFIAFLAAVKLLLALRSGQDDIVVGSPFLTRSLMDDPAMLGCFVDQLVLRSRVDLDATFAELVAQVAAGFRQASANQPVPPVQMAEALGLSVDDFNIRAYSLMVVDQSALPPVHSARMAHLLAALPGHALDLFMPADLMAAADALMPPPREGHQIVSLLVSRLDRQAGIDGALTCFRARSETAQGALADMTAALERIIAAVTAAPDKPLRAVAAPALKRR